MFEEYYREMIKRQDRKRKAIIQLKFSLAAIAGGIAVIIFFFPGQKAIYLGVGLVIIGVLYAVLALIDLKLNL
jgi:uncharacterized membrane protein YgaE (UPF0421/DUF939 family)